VAAGALTREVPTIALGIQNVERTASTQITPARPHVSFSIKLLVRRTPMIWLLPAKDDERPPPLDFCTSTTQIRSTAQMRVRMISTMYIAIFNMLGINYLLLFTASRLSISFLRNRNWSAK
jgi:hypothetical protein